MKRLRCSALIKQTKDDLFFSHDTWDTYSAAAPRIWKTHKTNVKKDGSMQIHATSFSGSPGWLASIDDFYITAVKGKKASLVVIETTNEIPNKELYDLLSPETVFSWQRTIVSNRLASNGEEWATLFSLYQSGTYNNQWMVVDLN